MESFQPVLFSFSLKNFLQGSLQCRSAGDIFLSFIYRKCFHFATFLRDIFWIQNDELTIFFPLSILNCGCTVSQPPSFPSDKPEIICGLVPLYIIYPFSLTAQDFLCIFSFHQFEYDMPRYALVSTYPALVYSNAFSIFSLSS